MKSRRANKMFDRYGMTLAELLVVLAIISIAGVLLSGDSYQRAQLRRAVSDLTSDIRYAQRLAMATGEPHMVRLTDNKQYNVYCLSDLTTPIKTVKLSGIKELNDNFSQVIQFTERGTVNGGRRIYISTDKYYQEFTISVSTGRVKEEDIKAKPK